MKFIKNAIIGIIKWASRQSDVERDYTAEKASAARYGNTIGSSKAMNQHDNIADSNNGMNFTVYSAIGGKVIQFRSYDPARDRHIGSLYIVTDKEDLGQELGQIITVESLNR